MLSHKSEDFQARRLETEMRTMTRKYEEAEEEKRRLEEQLRQRGVSNFSAFIVPVKRNINFFHF